MRNVQLTPQESFLLRKVYEAQGSKSVLSFPHGNNLVGIDDEKDVPKAVRAIKAFKALGWDKALVDGLVAKLKG
jgi:hypothetical protein